MAGPADTTATIIPCLRYRDAPAAIDWLCRAFGFERHAVYADGDTVHHAQLVFGNGMVMLGSADTASEWGRRIAQPGDIGGLETQSPCVVVADVDAHYARAVAAVHDMGVAIDQPGGDKPLAQRFDGQVAVALRQIIARADPCDLALGNRDRRIFDQTIGLWAIHRRRREVDQDPILRCHPIASS